MPNLGLILPAGAQVCFPGMTPVELRSHFAIPGLWFRFSSATVATFIKEEVDKLVFKMQCTESGRGKPMNLIM